MQVYLFCTLDTKGAEAEFVRQCLRDWGVDVVLVDAGCLGEPAVPADIGRETLFAAGGASWRSLVEANDRGAAVAAAANGATRMAVDAWRAGKLAGVFCLGGSAGTTIGTAAMRALPIGVPKVMVSTLASGQTRPYVGDKDITLVNSVVDIAGLNRLSRRVLHNAAAAMAGMLQRKLKATGADRPLIAATMFGVTTPCVQHARAVLEQAGYEVLVFHATGAGGQAMESLIAEGVIAGVLDITTTELADELVGGVLSAGPARLTAASRAGVPQVISVGATDMVNFGPPETVPAKFAARQFHHHNPTITLMRTTLEENAALGREIGHKASKAPLGSAAILLPLRGVSAIDAAGGPFDDPAARQALFQAIDQSRGGAELASVDCHINSPAFAEACAAKLLELLRRRRVPFLKES